MNAPHRMAAAVSTNAPIFMEATLVDVILDTSLTLQPSVVKTSMSAQRMTIRATANKFAETVQDHTAAPVGMATN